MGCTNLLELSLLEIIRQSGAIDEYQLASNLQVSLRELHQILKPLIKEGYVKVLTKHGHDCLQCPSRLVCPGSRIHTVSQDSTFSAYRLTSAGMRYRRQLVSNQ